MHWGMMDATCSKLSNKQADNHQQWQLAETTQPPEDEQKKEVNNE